MISVTRAVVWGLRGLSTPPRAFSSLAPNQRDLGALFAFSVVLVVTAVVISRWSVARIGPVFSFELLSEPLATVVYFLVYGFEYCLFVGTIAAFLLFFVRYLKLRPGEKEYKIALSLSSFLLSILIVLYALGLIFLSYFNHEVVMKYKDVGLNIAGFVPLGYLSNVISEIGSMKFPAAVALVVGCLALAAFVIYFVQEVFELLVLGVNVLAGGTL